MIAVRTVAGLTWRLLLGRRGWLTILACNGITVLVAWLVSLERMETWTLAGMREFLTEMVGIMVVTVLLPLSAVVFGTSAFGNEIEDGTLTYLLAKPTRRWRLVVAKWIAASGATALANLPGVLLAGWILVRNPLDPVVLGFLAGLGAGAILYGGLFIALGLYSRRALIIGLVYVLGWEGALSNLFPGADSLSVRAYVTSLSRAISERFLAEGLTGPLPMGTVITMSGTVLLLSFFLSVRRLQTMELVHRG